MTPMARKLVCECVALVFPHACTVFPTIQSSSTAFHCSNGGVNVTNLELKFSRR